MDQVVGQALAVFDRINAARAPTPKAPAAIRRRAATEGRVETL
jgi:hypothetical protein